MGKEITERKPFGVRINLIIDRTGLLQRSINLIAKVCRAI